MVCRASQFKRWGVPMDEIHRFRTKTDELNWIIPPGRANAGQPGRHNGGRGERTGSTTFHNELKRITEESLTLDEFNTRVTEFGR